VFGGPHIIKGGVVRSPSVAAIASVLCLLLAASDLAQSESQARQSVQTPEATASPVESRVTGVLLGTGGQPEEGTEVLLVEAQVWGLDGKPAATLPARGTSISGIVGDASGAPIVKGRCRTRADGSFELHATPGRYGVAVAVGPAKDLALLASSPDARTVVLDLTAKADSNVRNVSRKRE
jgi:hypothetical protein